MLIFFFFFFFNDTATTEIYTLSLHDALPILIKGIKVGAPELCLPSTIMSTVEPKYGVFEMPYIIVSRAHMKKVSAHPEVRKALFDPLPKQGLRVLGVWENGFRHITNNVRPIVKPDDLKGIKLRVPGGVWRVKMFKAYGGKPSPLPPGGGYFAPQTRGLDGQEDNFTPPNPPRTEEH